MKKEQLLKNISEMLKKHEDFLNDNPEFFHAIEERFFKAVNDWDDEDPEFISMDEAAEPDYYDDEEQYGEGYGDELFSQLPDEGYSDEQDPEQEELDEADKFLQEAEARRAAEQQASVEEGSDPNVAEAGDVQQEVPQEAEQESAAPVEEKKPNPYDWKSKGGHSEDVANRIKSFMDEGYSERESERMAGMRDFISLDQALNRSLNPSEPSPKMLEVMKDVATKWLHDVRRNTQFDPKKNPELSAGNKVMAAHDSAYQDFDQAYEELMNSEEFANMDELQQQEAINDFMENYYADEDNLDRITSAASSGEAYSEAAEIRKQELMDGFKALFEAGKKHIDDGGGYSAQAAGLDGGELSDQAAAQMVGTQVGDEGYQMNVKKDPAMVFAQQNKDAMAALKEKLAGKLDESQLNRMSAIDSLKPKQEEPKELKFFGEQQQQQEVPKVKTLEDEGLQHINDHLIEYAPLINMKGKSIGRNAPEHVQDGDLITAGTLGLVDAFRKYDPSKGASFKSHAARRIEGKMRDFVKAGGPNDVDAFFFDAMRDIMKNMDHLNQPAASTEGVVATPTEMQQPQTDIKKPEGVE